MAETKQCPFCGEEININAKKCKHCGEWLEETQTEVEEQPETIQNGNNSNGWGNRNPIVRGIVDVLTIIATILVLIIRIDSFSKQGIDFGSAIFETILGTLIFSVIIWIGLYIYMLPSIYAANRKHPQLVPLTFLNLFLGETVIGWVGAFFWASNYRHSKHTHS